MRSRHNLFLPALFTGFCLAAPSHAQTIGPRNYGIVQTQILQLPAAAFVPLSDKVVWRLLNDGYWEINESPFADPDLAGFTRFAFWAPVNLPNGAVVTHMTLYFDDRHPSSLSENVRASLLEFSGGDGTTPPATSVLGKVISNHYAFGVRTEPVTPFEIDNHNQYVVRMSLGLSDPVTDQPQYAFKAVDLRYHLKISAPPRTATFADVPPDHPFFQAIEALGAAGITSGCGQATFCPDGVVTRAQLAKFLANALGL